MQHAALIYPTANEEQLRKCLYDISGLYYCRDANNDNDKWYAIKPWAADKIDNLPSPKNSDQVVHRRSPNAVHKEKNKNVRSHGPIEQNNNNNNCSATNLHVPDTQNSNSSTKTTSSGRLSAKSNNATQR